MVCLASRAASGLARSLLEYRLLEWGLGGLVDDLQSVAGELVANAVQSTPHGEVRVRLVREPASVLLCVWDSSGAMPVPRPVVELRLDDIAPDPEALDPGHDDGTGGWGLPIVQALAHECGVRPTPPEGKWVWARVQA